MKHPLNSTSLTRHSDSSRRLKTSSKERKGRSVSDIRGLSRRGAFSIVVGALLVAFFLCPVAQVKFARGGSVTAFDESISTFQSNDCSTPKTEWNLGQTACAVATGAPDDRRIAWVAPNGAIAQVSGFFSGTSSDSYAIPTGSDFFAQVGTWTVETIDPNGVTFAQAEFVVRESSTSKVVDLAIGKFGPSDVTPGSNLNFRIEVINHGPDDAVDVTITDSVPPGTTFVSETQNSGPTFTCTTPTVGSATGSVSCTIASLPPETAAVFTLAFNVGATTPDGTVITNTANVGTATSDLDTGNNDASASATVSTAANQCTLNCPANITQDNDPNQCSAVVSYSTPTTSGPCGSPPESNVVCSPPSGSTFPTGATPIVCTTLTGGSCSFTVTVHDTRPPVQPTISCPGNMSVSESSPDSGEATVSFAPTTTGNCVTTVCKPPSGSSFTLGTTQVDCKATDSAGNEVTCSFNVTVTSGAACSISCPSDVTQSAPSGQCSANVSYSAPSTTGNCGTVTCSPASGSTFPVGTTLVVCASSEGPSCDFLVTVVAAAPPTITTCATDKTVYVTTDCSGAIPNLINEVTTTGCNVIVSQSPSAGALVPPGTYAVVITAENSAGQATCTVTVTVLENFTGFFSPVSNPPSLNTVNAGRAIPVKFSLHGDKGLDIFAVDYPVSGPINCDASAPSVEVTETLTAGGSSLSYDPTADQYTYVWKTDSSWAGTCRQLVIVLKDGCMHVANFKFR